MPRVAEVDGAAIYIYFADHNPPHFHAIEAEHEALIEIATLAVLRGSVPSMRAVRRWAEANRATLEAAWARCNP